MFIALPPTLEDVDISNFRQSYQTEVTRLQLFHELFVEHQKLFEDDNKSINTKIMFCIENLILGAAFMHSIKSKDIKNFLQ